MKGFNFEKDLDHQTRAVASTVAAFEDLQITEPRGVDANFVNPRIEFIRMIKYRDNLKRIMAQNGIECYADLDSNIMDIMMETGTGKTYTYTKTIFELNRNYGLFKFIIVVPTLSIKAGTIDFLKSASAREHFRGQYSGKSLHLHIVESRKSNKSKATIPQAITEFVNAGKYEKDSIQVMIVNAGMINSDTMQRSFDKGLFDRYNVPFEAIGAVSPVVIIDEPHKFAQGNKTWDNIQKMRPQLILRYGATFPDKEKRVMDPFTGKTNKKIVKDYHNLIYTLTAVDAFNRDLVKGVIGHITEFQSGQNVMVRFTGSNGTEATFELVDGNGGKRTFKVGKRDSLSIVHEAMKELYVENINKSTVLLSNGLELKKGGEINPYSYAQTLQETMISKAVHNHFKIERQLLTRADRIKPLTLFFIDNIDEYRNDDGYIRRTLEGYVKAEVESMLKEDLDAQYKSLLEKTLADISKTHGGYFSKDNSEKDEAIEQEINEILHDKQSILDIDNPRRFIFSKWTLREGWDNPNVFQICKLRSSGSETSKLQEVGRGLRLPVNEYGNRVKGEQFYLNYFVDFTESDFVDKLVKEINDKSGAISIDTVPDNLTDIYIKEICEKYNLNKEELLDTLGEQKVISYSHKLKEGGFDYIKLHYPLIFEGVNTNKIRVATDERKKITVRTEKYSELKDLWEKLNEKVILEYKFKDEAEFRTLLTHFFATKLYLQAESIDEIVKKIAIENNLATVDESSSVPYRRTLVVTMRYSDFIKELSKALNINMTTLHSAIVDSHVEINDYLNPTTIRIIKQNFNYYLMVNAIDRFGIEYHKVSNCMHPTKLTDDSGEALAEISASDIGLLSSKEKVADSYYFNEMFFDSELERDDIKTQIEQVVVFTKIPKNSIKIPVAGGKSYSPDFAYVLHYKNGDKKLYFIVETKNVAIDDTLREEEKYKIKHAEQFFNNEVKIVFKKQLSNDKILNLITEITSGESKPPVKYML
jgi:type III restriction enzyme